jgi:hypothetical protein
MRPLPWVFANQYRAQVHGFETGHEDAFGVFMVPYNGAKLRVIACAGFVSEQEHGREYAWDHCSVSLPKRIPNWLEMSYIRHLFWNPEDTVLQFHPPATDYVNFHPNTLHLWKPVYGEVLLPPKEMV